MSNVTTQEQVEAEFVKRGLLKGTILTEGLDKLEDRMPVDVQRVLDEEGIKDEESIPAFLKQLRESVPEGYVKEFDQPDNSTERDNAMSESETTTALTSALEQLQTMRTSIDDIRHHDKQTEMENGKKFNQVLEEMEAMNSRVTALEPEMVEEVATDSQQSEPVAKPAAVREPPVRTPENTVQPPTGAIDLEPPSESKRLLSAAFSRRPMLFIVAALLVGIIGGGGAYFARDFVSWRPPIAPNPATEAPSLTEEEQQQNLEFNQLLEKVNKGDGKSEAAESAKTN